MVDYQWQDPFADDEAARDRERRRAERETRRRARREPQAAADRPRPPRSAATAAVPAIAAAGPRRRPGPTGGSPNGVRARQVVGVLIFAAVVGLVAFGVVKLVDRLDSSDTRTAEPAAVQVEDLTIPEGEDRHQIADDVRKAGLRGSYLNATKEAPKGFDLAKYGAQDAPNLEGFLFPATYELEKNASAKDLVARQLDAFRDNVAGVDLAYAESKNLNVYDVLKIASMVEREVVVPSERRLVAGVIYNRLAAGNPLGIDATIRYEDQNYDEPLTESRLNEDTPYNTRLNAGLPPTPIGNPGLASIKAAANPAKTDYFYFVVKPCGDGRHVFAKTQAEFDRASADYQQALAEQGGSPTDC
jgi:uncharacterized YceG family protein